MALQNISSQILLIIEYVGASLHFVKVGQGILLSMLSAVQSGMVGTTVYIMETVTDVGAGGVSPVPGPAPTARVVPPAAAPGGGTSAAPATASGADARARVGLAVGAIFAVVAGTLRIFEWLHLPRSMCNILLLK